MNNSNSAVIKSKVLEVIQFIIGIFNIFMFGIVTLVIIATPDIEDKGMVVFIFIVFDLIWIMMIMFAIKRNRVARRFKRYSSVMLNQESFAISKLSNISGESEAVVLKNLKQMLKWRFIRNAYICNETNRIVFNSLSKQTTIINNNFTTGEEENIVVTCKSCGGINKIKKGSIQECEYCNSLIEGAGNGR